jgi:ubiquinone/menaquinone biosynthesis C-methylase UbiE
MHAEPADGQPQLPPVDYWLEPEALESIYSAGYWNDLEAEKGKEWWIADGSAAAFDRLHGYLEATGLLSEYRTAEQYLAELPGRDLQVADLAAGIGWTSSLLSRLENVAAVHALDISRHRLELLFPQAVRMFAGRPPKLRRKLGSFYDLRFADESLDVVFVSSAFHHAANPLRLLTEIDRVLRKGGHLILIGENVMGPGDILRRALGKLWRERRLTANFYELFPPDDATGDHYYRVSDYYFFNQMLGYRMVTFAATPHRTATVISRKAAPGGNPDQPPT